MRVALLPYIVHTCTNNNNNFLFLKESYVFVHTKDNTSTYILYYLCNIVAAVLLDCPCNNDCYLNVCVCVSVVCTGPKRLVVGSATVPRVAMKLGSGM